MKTFGTYCCKYFYHTIQYYLMFIYAFETLNFVRDTYAASHLDMAKMLLSSGKYNDALPHFHEAISADPNNYLTFFKRATVYLVLSRPKSALDDLNRALEIKQDFASALASRANVHFKLGNLDESLIDVEKLLSHDPSNVDAAILSQNIERLRNKMNLVQSLIEEDQYNSALPILNEIVQDIPWSPDILRYRARTFEKIGKIIHAINDYRQIAKLEVDAKTYLTIAELLYSLGDIEESLNSVRECLKLDPDDKSCMDFYKPAKKINNSVKSTISAYESKDNDECAANGKKTISMIKNKQSPLVYSLKSIMCHCLSKSGDTTDGLKICDEAISYSGEGVRGIEIDKAELLCDKAELYADLEEYDEALKMYQESIQIKATKRAKQGAEKIKRLKKQKSKRDYYKILGLKKNAQDREINKAYRKLAAKWHPDRFHNESDKKKAQTKFMEIADAKTVLSDPEKRKIYDLGEDPLDPESRQSYQQPHFYNDFSNFGGGGPFQFKFSFG